MSDDKKDNNMVSLIIAGAMVSNLSMFDDKSLKDVFNYLAKHGYLAKIAGKHHSWSCLVNGKVIAKFKGNNNIIMERRTSFKSIDNHLLSCWGMLYCKL